MTTPPVERRQQVPSQAMQVHFGIEELRPEWPGAVACIGTFDGVHLGHAAVISQAVAVSRETSRPCVLVTFDRHPAAILAPARCPKLIAPLQTNLREIERLGVSATLVIPFNAWLSRLSASSFLEDILQRAVRAESLVVGHDFAMGNGREGNTAWLAERIETTVVPPYEMNGHRVSSSEIRSLVEAGEVERAAHFLGRDYSLSGVIVAGDRIGRSIGYPTANLAKTFNQVVPADGVYAGWFGCEKGRYAAALSIGTRPTVDGCDRRTEAFLLDYDGDPLYGLAAEIGFTRRLRGQVRFDSLDALKEQMALDVAATRSIAETGYSSTR